MEEIHIKICPKKDGQKLMQYLKQNPDTKK